MILLYFLLLTKMFDLNYYNQLRKAENFLDIEKAQGHTRKHIHEAKLTSVSTNKLMEKQIENLPDGDFKHAMQCAFYTKGGGVNAISAFVNGKNLT